MRQVRFLTLMFALTLCVGATECSELEGSSSGKSNTSSFNASTTPPGEQVGVSPVPEPSGALIFGIGALIAGLATRRKA